MGKKHQEGFTLIELMVLMMVFALTLGLGVPAFTAMVANARMSGTGNDLVGSLHVARAAATTRNAQVVLCASTSAESDAPSCDDAAALADGWIVFADDDADGQADAGETVLLGHGPLHDTIRRASGTGADAGPPAYVAFAGNGFIVEVPGLGPPVRNLQFCDGRGDRDTGGGVAAGRWIMLSPAGHPGLVDRVDRLQGDLNPLGGC